MSCMSSPPAVVISDPSKALSAPIYFTVDRGGGRTRLSVKDVGVRPSYRGSKCLPGRESKSARTCQCRDLDESTRGPSHDGRSHRVTGVVALCSQCRLAQHPLRAQRLPGYTFSTPPPSASTKLPYSASFSLRTISSLTGAWMNSIRRWVGAGFPYRV